MSHIYKITNLINNKIYIGYTTNKISDRFQGHINCSRKTKYKKYYFYRSLNKYGKDNFKIESIVSGDFNKILLGELEKHYIRLYNSNNPKIGYNLNSGGLGGSKDPKTQIQKDKISKTLMGHHYNKGIPKSKEHCVKVSKTLKKMADSGIRWSTCKFVYQYDLQDNLIQRFDSVAKAAKALNISTGTINKIVNGESKNPRCGFKFKIERYAE